MKKIRSKTVVLINALTALLVLLLFGNCARETSGPPMSEYSQPAVPRSFSYSNITPDTVSVCWESSFHNVNGHYIYLNTGNVKPAAPAATVYAETNNWQLENLNPGTSYHIWVASFSSTGIVSEAVKLELTAGAPSAPSGLNFTYSSSNNAMTLTWQDTADNETGFAVYYDLAAAQPASVSASAAADATNCTIYSLHPGLLYYFWLTASNSYGESLPLSGLKGTVAGNRSAKRGVCYHYQADADLTALCPGVSWWYNWGPNSDGATNYQNYDLSFAPMAWNGNFDETRLRNFYSNHPDENFLLGFNEPNFQDQANMTPAYAAQRWVILEEIAADFDLKLVSPAVNYCGGCTLVDGSPIDNDPTTWLDMFFTAYQNSYGQQPQVDYIAVHWYDYGLESYLDKFTNYNKPIWLTEFANWHDETITLAEQIDYMENAVAMLEAREDIYRYAWFIGRASSGPNISLLKSADGVLTELGQAYIDASF